jgi:CheY-like chemotaxis protein
MTPRMSHWSRGNMTTNEHSPRRTVLIVDDDDEIRHSTQNLLIMSNFNVLLAADGVAALKVLTRQPVDALVIDLMMPRLDGVGVVRALVDMPPENRPAVIIVISFHYELHARFAGLGVRRVLAKPVDVPTLVGELQAALKEHAAHSEHVPT